MSGERFLLDTNAIVALLQGNPAVLDRVRDAEWVGISIISHLEFLSFTGLTDDDRLCFRDFLQEVHRIALQEDQRDLIDLIVAIRTRTSVKLPDAIIAATAITNRAKLVSADKSLRHIANLDLVLF